MTMKNQLAIILLALGLLLSEISLGDGDHQTFEIKDFELEAGEILPSAILSYVIE